MPVRRGIMAVLAVALVPAVPQSATPAAEPDSPTHDAIRPVPIATNAIPDFLLTSTNRLHWVAQFRSWFARELGIDPASTPCRHLAASVVAKGVRRPDGSFAFATNDLPGGRSPAWLGQALAAYAIYRPIDQAIERAPVPDLFREVLRRHYCGLILWPIRAAPPKTDTARFCRQIEAIPKGSQLVTLAAGDKLKTHLARILPEFDRMSGLEQKLVYDYLVSLNPLLRSAGSVRVDAARADRAIGAALGPDPYDQRIFEPLLDLDPTLKPNSPGGGPGQTETVVTPADKDTVRVWRYRLLPGGHVLIPPADCLRAAAFPARLHLGSPLADRPPVPAPGPGRGNASPPERTALSDSLASGTPISRRKFQRHLQNPSPPNGSAQPRPPNEGIPVDFLMEGEPVVSRKGVSQVPLQSQNFLDQRVTLESTQVGWHDDTPTTRRT